MVAFILGGIVALATLAISVLMVFAAGMSDVPNASSGVGAVFFPGMILAGLIVASHWLPHMSW